MQKRVFLYLNRELCPLEEKSSWWLARSIFVDVYNLIKEKMSGIVMLPSEIKKACAIELDENDKEIYKLNAGLKTIVDDLKAA